VSTFLGVGRSARAADERSVLGALRVAAQTAALLSLLTLGSLVMLAVALLTLFRLRRLYAALAALIGRAVLRVWGVRVELAGALPFPRAQTIYVSNHTSSVDVFVLIALHLPNTRFFLSGFLRKVLPIGLIGYLTGIFWTVPQSQPERRRAIFAGAARTLARTGQSVYLSPEGVRVTTGELGPFNKGAFHLAADLHVPIVPFYIDVPRRVDPGLGLDVRPGVVTVEVLPPVDTSAWTVQNLDVQRADVRARLEAVHRRRRAARAQELA
jgi:1-acyl-sn-glycerol-3-phosphate acyltransferase